MIGAEDVDHVIEAALELGAVIGHVGGEISVAVIRFDESAIHIVAKIGRTEQDLLAVLPIVGQLALGRRQTSLVDETFCAQILDRLSDFVGFAVDQRALGKEHVMLDAKSGQIGAYHLQHHLDGLGAHGRKPFRLFHIVKPRTVFLRKHFTDGT